MDIFNYIKSKDIRKYLKDIDYKMSMLQAFMLVWRTRYDTVLSERKTMYKYIMDNFTDIKVKPCGEKPEIVSFKSFIKDYIKGCEEDIENFKNNKNGETYVIYTKDKKYIDFSSYNECYKYLLDHKNELEITYYECITKRKNGIANNKLYKCDDIRLNKDLEIIKADIHAHYGKHEDTQIMPYSFYIDFPCPFNRGDIITKVKEKDQFAKNGMEDFSLFCVDIIDNWDTKKCIEQGIKDPDHKYDLLQEKMIKIAGYHDSLDYSAYMYNEYNYYRNDNDEEVLLPKGQYNRFFAYSGCDNTQFIDMEYADEKDIVGPRKIIYMFREYLKYDNKYDKIIPLEKLLQCYDIMKAGESSKKLYPWNIENYDFLLDTKCHNHSAYYFESHYPEREEINEI